MSWSLISLVAFALWTLVPLIGVGGWRVRCVLSGQASNSFTAGEKHGPDWYWRFNRAHLNCTENLPIFGALALTGAVMDVSDPVFQYAAAVVLPARILQSVVHVSSGGALAVHVRFTFFSVQLLCFSIMGFILLSL